MTTATRLIQSDYCHYDQVNDNSKHRYFVKHFRKDVTIQAAGLDAYLLHVQSIVVSTCLLSELCVAS